LAATVEDSYGIMINQTIDTIDSLDHPEQVNQSFDEFRRVHTADSLFLQQMKERF